MVIEIKKIESDDEDEAIAIVERKDNTIRIIFADPLYTTVILSLDEARFVYKKLQQLL